VEMRRFMVVEPQHKSQRASCALTVRIWLKSCRATTSPALARCPRQYSSGSKIQVDERPASVITQILTPVLRLYTDISRNPCSSET
jgi:hypothetical protein